MISLQRVFTVLIVFLAWKLRFLAFLGLNATFKRERRRREIFLLFLTFVWFLIRVNSLSGKKKLSFWFSKKSLCSRFFFKFLFSPKEFFFFQKPKSPADLRKCGFYRDSSQNLNFISAVSQTLYRIKEIFLFWFFWR